MKNLIFLLLYWQTDYIEIDYGKVLHKKTGWLGTGNGQKFHWQLSPKIQELLRGDKYKTVPQKI